MGKYMRKTKTAGEVAVMEVSQSSLGVLTRAKTLALRRLQQSPAPSPSPASPVSSGSYLQLRSRRLEKPPVAFSGHESKRQKHTHKEGCTRNPRTSPSPRVSSSLRVASTASMPERSVSLGRVNDEGDQTAEEAAEKSVGKIDEIHASGSKNENIDLVIEEASFGENILDFESRERTTRESTPSSLIRNPDIIRTPSSSTKPTTSAIETNHRNHYSSNRHIPTSREMDEFFALAEEKQQQHFIEKYNFDPVKDTPLPGRYEWEKVAFMGDACNCKSQVDAKASKRPRHEDTHLTSSSFNFHMRERENLERERELHVLGSCISHRWPFISVTTLMITPPSLIR